MNNSNRTQNFVYDNLNRITTAYTSGTNWGENFTLDPWGNLTNIGGVTGKTNHENLNAAPASAQNQLPGFGYDAAGNMTSNGSATFTYDAENRLIATAGMSYIYDGDGKRVEKCTEGATAGTCATGATGTLYWTGPGSDPLVETDLAGNTLETYIFFNGNRIARRDASTKAVHFYFSDHLGTHSILTDANGDMPPQNESDYYPYGGEIPISGSDSNHYKFTGKERDSESSLDYFGFRHHASTLGRFMQPDSAGMMAVDIANPQTLNRYAYVVNNPLNLIDPFGLDCVYLNSSGTEVENGGVDQQSSSGECGRTGGYWVEGAVTNVSIGGDAETIFLTGTTNGTDNNTSASYQQNSTVNVGQYQNTFINPAGHIAFGIDNGPRYGLNPKSDLQFMKYAISRRMHGHVGGGPGVPGAIKVQPGKSVLTARIPVTGMQAGMVLDSIWKAQANPPNYDVGGGPTTCDCASWPQQVLGDAGINTGAPTQDPGTLVNQIDDTYPQQQ